MEERKPAAAPLASERWALIRRSAMRGEAKLAWLFLFHLFGSKVETSMWVHSSSVGADQGADDRNGRRSIETLKKCGWLAVLERDRNRGGYHIFLEDPLKVVIARRMSVENAAQGELFADEQADVNKAKSRPEDQPGILPLADPGAACAQHVDATCCAHPPPMFKTGVVLSVSKSARAEVFKSNTPHPGLNKGDNMLRTSAAAEPEDDPIGAAIADRLCQLRDDLRGAVSPEEKARKVAAVADWLRGQVRDPHTYPSTFLRVATAIVEGLLPEATVNAILRTLQERREAGELRTSAGPYFQKAVEKAMEAKGVPWGKL